MAAVALNQEFSSWVCNCRRRESSSEQRRLLSESEADAAKSRYRSGVLVGNWFNRRAQYQPPPNDWVTVNQIAYPCKHNPDFGRDRLASDENKKWVEHGIGAEFLLEYPGKAFRNNFTTTNDAFFRVFKRELCGPQPRKYSSRKDQWLPQTELSKNYGNVSKVCWDHEPKPEPQVNKRFLKPKADFNEPYLYHLDIDPNLPFKPHLMKKERPCR